MPVLRLYDYAIVRVVPRVDRGEFLNAGVIVCVHGRAVPAGAHRTRRRRACSRSRPGSTSPPIRGAMAAIPAVCAGRRICRAVRGPESARNASTGWSRRATRASRPRRCIPADATKSRRRAGAPARPHGAPSGLNGDCRGAVAHIHHRGIRARALLDGRRLIVSESVSTKSSRSGRTMKSSPPRAAPRRYSSGPQPRSAARLAWSAVAAVAGDLRHSSPTRSQPV